MTDYNYTDETTSRTYYAYKNRTKGKIFGVCARIADRFDFNVTAVRIVTLLSLLVFIVPTVVTYCILALVMDNS